MDHPLYDYALPFVHGLGEATLRFMLGVLIVVAAGSAVVVVPVGIGLLTLILSYVVVLGTLYAVTKMVPVAISYHVETAKDAVSAIRDRLADDER